MINYKEIVRSVQTFREVGSVKSSTLEFAWILNQIAQEDIAQSKQILGESGQPNVFTLVQLYTQRLVEIGYIFTEVFIRNEYQSWKPKSESPRIIDLGGDPGAITTLYWKYRAPNAQITIVEANPATASVMNKSLARRGLKEVQIINAAVSGDNIGKAQLHLHRPGNGWHTQDFIGSDTSRLGEYVIEVPKIKLSELISPDEQIDLLKMDIEGLEGEVMRELADSGKLVLVKQIIMEFHHGQNEFPGNSIVEMLDILKGNGFRITESHITVGKGLRTKKDVEPFNLATIASSDEKTFVTLSAIRGV